MIGHRSPISGIDASDTYVATAGYDSRVILWRRSDGEALSVGWHDHLANQCRFSRSGNLLATSSSDFSTRIWSVPDMRLLRVLGDHEDDVEMSVISPSEDAVATASRDTLVRVFGIDGTLRARLAGHEADVLSVEWVAEGKELVTSSDDGTVRRWDPVQGSLEQTIDLGDVETDTFAVGEAGALFAGNDEGQIVIIRPDGTTRHDAHQAGIKRVIYDPSRRLLVSSSYDRTIRLWRHEDGGLTHVRTSDVPGAVWLRSCAFAGADTLVFGTFGTTYATYSLETGEWDLEAVEDTGGVNAVAYADGDVYTVGDAGVVRRGNEVVSRPGTCCNFLISFHDRLVTGGQLGVVFDAGTGEQLHQHRSPLNCAVIVGSGDGAQLVIGTYTGEGLVFEGTPGRDFRLVRTLALHDNAIKGITANADTLFSVSATADAAFHDIPSYEPRQMLKDAHDMIADGAAVLPDGRFVSVSRDRKLRIFDGDRVTVVDTPHENSHKAVTVDPATGLVAVTGYRGRVSVYDPASDEWVYNRRLSTSGISSATPTDRPGRFVVGSYDGNAYPVLARTG